MKRITVNFSLNDVQQNLFEEEQRETGDSKSTIIRRAMIRYLKENASKAS